jgi:hypothetical protein
MGIMNTMIIRSTCRICEIIKMALTTAVMAIWAFGESAGRARAASELYRQGYIKEAKALMLRENDV